MQSHLRDKIQALTETLGILFSGSQVAVSREGGAWSFAVSGKSLRFTEEFLSNYDVDHVLSMCHIALSELRTRPTKTTIHIAAPAQLQ